VLHSLGYVAPVRLSCASVVTVHDLNYRSRVHQIPLLRRTMLRAFVSASVRACDAVIAVSRFTRDEIARTMPFAAHKLHVVHEAPRARPPTAERSPITGRYFVAFSSTSPNKNLARLLSAYRMARPSVTLVMIGHRPDWASTDTDATWTGYVSDSEVHRLLAGSDGLFFPSLYEGFGLPLVEAMQAGVPIACSTGGSLPEIASDAALFFAPEDTSAIAGAFRRMACDHALRAHLIARGTERVQAFSWHRAATETLAVYHGLVGR
jgi:glycosyltransferase involved in cell wall biosynthesis